MKLGTVLGALVGFALLAWLLHDHGIAPVLAVLHQAGWRIVPVVLFHLVQIGFAGAAWQAVAGPAPPRLGLGAYMVLRWVREAVNGLLPVAQIGGNLLAIRLLHRGGVPTSRAAAGCLADLTVEFVTQVGFILCGLLTLLDLVHDSRAAWAALGGVALAGVAAAGLVVAQRLGLARWIERGIQRAGAASGWAGADGSAGLHDALMQLYRDRPALLRAASCHSVSWLLGSVEVWLAMRALGHPVSLGAGLVIESLGQAIRGAAFAVPGGLGVQEGGFVAVCALFGVPGEVGIALSLVKRARELIFGLPALIAWPWVDAAARSATPEEATG